MSWISEEILSSIDEKIMLDVEISVIQNKILKAENENKEGFKQYLEKILKSLLNQRIELVQFHKKNGVKISEPKRVSDMFIEYYYSVKYSGGYRDGYKRYWDKGIQFRLKQKMKGYFMGMQLSV
ncbi:hypothetical protein [Heyndrickxia camelliae]|uniref:Uncharacterized protein n=1 Tax=Heyndrickxia camelliae TaxID=1707093 RepID=A0A2N3LFZ8_9BACI|nr:hypothetical protein [Heyndrickxia camelliae]PKR83546.1 hypothetical protein CWO92_18445 [Heyndrickxia camelliae]